ncbi:MULTISPECIES: flagellar basal body P-ring formation chaperone FlgA [Nitrincola]|uniref:Flagella basal body P-ring formation protein FlgA n=1 Tax=Nitrincola nitratireducens TaxID=1229521 RepID=W9UXR7_9GAMM|nr:MULTISPECIES: flagellar basal body P-ring formation chaperone FlgA [Nitrincola]EXJ09521.1 flagellar basal body P-ring biosynthesis protein FlgA [Nitrincola nitratireducens]
MNSHNLPLVLLFLLIFLKSTSSLAIELPESIQKQVEEAIIHEFSTRLPESRLDVSVNPVNQNLTLAACEYPLEIQIPFNSGQRVTAKATCHQPFWSLFVTAQVRQMMTVVVSAKPLVRNSRISASDIKLVEQDISRIGQDYFTREQDVIGKHVRRQIGSDQVINARMLEVAMLVSRGDQVMIEAQRGSLTIRMPGIALEDGRQQQQIRVQNSQSGNEVRAIIIAPGVVRVQ